MLLLPTAGGAWGNPNLLVEINDTAYTKQDFLDWWPIWKEAATPLPETPDAFVDWMLLFQEAETMQLFNRPRYRSKVSVFLRARSLMLLKQEEVDSRIPEPTRADLWPLYQKTYVPRFNLEMVSIGIEQAKAEAAVAAVLAEGASLEAAAESAGLLDSQGYMAETGLMRASRLPEPLLEVVQTLQTGDQGGPISFAHYTYFFKVLERDDGTEEDFASLRDTLARQWRKQQEQRLTVELIDRLKEKYQVEVHQEVVAQIGLEPLDPELAEQMAVRIGNYQVQAGAVQEAVAKDFKLRYGHHGDVQQELPGVRQRVIADMLSQTLTGMEALDRHYEERDPFRKTYRFYCQNRMIKELEAELVAPQVAADSEAIEAAYRANLADFTREGLVELAMVETSEQALAEQVNQRLLRGEDFQQAVAPIAPLGVEERQMPVDHLEEPLRQAVSTLQPGQASKMIPVGGKVVFIKLLNRGQQQVMPLEMVRDQVAEDLKQEQFAEARADLVDKLRHRSEIKIKEKAWRQVRNQLEEETQ